MKDFPILLLAAFGLLIGLNSCDENATSTTIARVGTLGGTVALYDQYGKLIGPAAGLEIFLSGKSELHTATTAQDGTWRVEHLSAGVYDIVALKEEYATTKLSGYGFLGNGNQSPDTIRLAQLPLWGFSDLHVEFRDSIGYILDSVLTNPATGAQYLKSDTLAFHLDTLRPVLFGRISEKSPFASYSYMQVFLGLDESVSSTSNIGSVRARLSERDEFALLVEPALNQSTAVRGDRIYVIAYPLAPWGSTLTDAETGKPMNTRLGKNQSDVISFVW